LAFLGIRAPISRGALVRFSRTRDGTLSSSFGENLVWKTCGAVMAATTDFSMMKTAEPDAHRYPPTPAAERLA
jgi:hypothetical protein